LQCRRQPAQWPGEATQHAVVGVLTQLGDFLAAHTTALVKRREPASSRLQRGFLVEAIQGCGQSFL
jgi:hypothetical protein